MSVTREEKTNRNTFLFSHQRAELQGLTTLLAGEPEGVRTGLPSALRSRPSPAWIQALSCRVTRRNTNLVQDKRTAPLVRLWPPSRGGSVPELLVSPLCVPPAGLHPCLLVCLSICPAGREAALTPPSPGSSVGSGSGLSVLWVWLLQPLPVL